MRIGPSQIYKITFLLLIFFSGLGGLILSAQESQTEAAQQQADTVVIHPIPATEISVEYDESSELIEKSGKLHLKESDIAELEEQIDTIYSVVDAFLGDSILNSLQGANVRELDNARAQVGLQMDHIAGYQTSLTKNTREIEEATVDLSVLELRWQLTKEQADEKGVPEALQLRVDKVLRRIDSVNSLLKEDFTFLLVKEDALSRRNALLKAIHDSITERKMEISKSLFSKDMPSFFEDLANLEDSTLISNHIGPLKKAFSSDIKLIKSKFKIQFWAIVIFIIIYLGISVWFKKSYKRLIPGDKFVLNHVHLALIESPVATVLFVSMLLLRFLFFDLATSLQFFSVSFLMFPLFIIVFRSYSKKASPWIELLTVFYFLTYSYELMYFPDILQRIALLLLSLSGSVLFLLMIIKRAFIIPRSKGFLSGFLRTLLGLIALLSLLAILGNLAGAFRMAEYFTLVFIEIVILFLMIFVATRVVNALIFIMLASKTWQGLNVVREDFHIVHKKSTRLINLFLWIHFLLGALDLLHFKDKFLEWGENTLHAGRKVGAVDITPASILMFVFVIWLSIFITRIITSVLAKDIFTRVHTAKGMPTTVIMLLKVILITGGFFLAAAAAGMHLNNLSIIFGAFSVGIGFGLQNIFNNMVSGMILAFERPIKIGDTVQVGELMGVVQSIGFRASTIKSFDGSEVIVPNGNLISNSMINWTRSDYNRRMDLRVNVKYGTDSKLVLDLLKQVATSHDKVRKNPEPNAYFLGFGESAMNFRLLAWTNIENRLSVESELHVLVQERLGEAGIEIPFPQRDLHIRSGETSTKGP